jgi:hypothetical protein
LASRFAHAAEAQGRAFRNRFAKQIPKIICSVFTLASIYQ